MGGKSSKVAEVVIPEVSCFINGRSISVPEGTSILNASKLVLPRAQGIPTLCYHPHVSTDQNCDVCKVEVNGQLVASCGTAVSEGMSISTYTPQVNQNINAVLRRMLTAHPLDCPTCPTNGGCTFQDYLARYDVKPSDLNDFEQAEYLNAHNELLSEMKDYFGNFAVELDASKCIGCKRCIRVCEELQGMGILAWNEATGQMSAFEGNADLSDTGCISCGQCTFVCPTGAIALNSGIPQVLDWIEDEDILVVGQTAPAVRVTIAEDLGYKAGDVTEEQMVEGMRCSGFDYVFDTNFTADLTILEEGSELIERVKAGGPFPMFTSCCPAWINLCETKYPEFLPNLSTCKSPQQMMGSLVKEFWAPKVGIDAAKIRTVSIMPCTAKKDECVRENMFGDVDIVLTTRELAQLFTLKNIKVGSLEGTLYDDPLGESTGAAVIFGATGGVMEAAVRTAYEVIVGEPLGDVNFVTARGLGGIREASVPIGDLVVNIAIAHTAAEMQNLLESIKAGTSEYHFVEFMSCKGGCIGGGGNPKVKGSDSPLDDRWAAIYQLDENNQLRKSHENPSVIKLYQEYLEWPLGERSHHLLHCKYNNRKK